MIWKDDISFDGFQKRIDEWYKDKEFELCDPPIDAQFALDLIFKTLVDNKEHYEYLTTMPESTEQTNSIMLDLILRKYSRKYRKYVKKQKRCSDCKYLKVVNDDTTYAICQHNATIFKPFDIDTRTYYCDKFEKGEIEC